MLYARKRQTKDTHSAVFVHLQDAELLLDLRSTLRDAPVEELEGALGSSLHFGALFLGLIRNTNTTHSAELVLAEVTQDLVYRGAHTYSFFLCAVSFIFSAAKRQRGSRIFVPGDTY